MKSILEPEPRAQVGPSTDKAEAVKSLGLLYVTQLIDLEQRLRLFMDSGAVNLHMPSTDDVMECSHRCRGCVLKKMLEEIDTTREALKDAG